MVTPGRIYYVLHLKIKGFYICLILLSFAHVNHTRVYVSELETDVK